MSPTKSVVTCAQVRPPVLPDCADKKYPLTGLLLTFNLASLTASDCNLASDTVLSLGVPIDVAAPIKVTNKLAPLAGAVQNLIPLAPSKSVSYTHLTLPTTPYV